ncbi:MAG: 7-cyano-7-deazaguanine synthase, partial [Syntrophobacterales bacterium]
MDKRLEKLQKILQDMGSVLVAFSGGVDSSFLLHVAHMMLGDRAQAVTFVSPFLSRIEKERATLFCKEKGIKHIILEVDPLEVEQIRANPPDRCYHCKRELYTRALDETRRIGAG